MIRIFTREDRKTLRELQRTIGRNCTRLREERGIRLETCAALLGCNIHILQQFEQGKGQISLVMIVRLAHILSVLPQVMLESA